MANIWFIDWDCSYLIYSNFWFIYIFTYFSWVFFCWASLLASLYFIHLHRGSATSTRLYEGILHRLHRHPSNNRQQKTRDGTAWRVESFRQGGRWKDCVSRPRARGNEMRRRGLDRVWCAASAGIVIICCCYAVMLLFFWGGITVIILEGLPSSYFKHRQN